MIAEINLLLVGSLQGPRFLHNLDDVLADDAADQLHVRQIAACHHLIEEVKKLFFGTRFAERTGPLGIFQFPLVFRCMLHQTFNHRESFGSTEFTGTFGISSTDLGNQESALVIDPPVKCGG